jgi:hypothetical protein
MNAIYRAKLMKVSLLYILVCLICANIYAAETVEGQPITPQRSTTNEVASDQSIDDETTWKTIIETPGVSKYMHEEVAKIMRAIKTPTENDIPSAVFEIRPELKKSIKGSAGYYVQSLAITASHVWSLVPKTISSTVNFLASPVISSVANKATKGDAANFPDISLQRIHDILLMNKVDSRISFAKLPVRTTSFSFETSEPRLFTTGYKGQLIIVDFAYGNCLAEYGDEPAAISQYVGPSPLDSLVSLKEPIEPLDWIKKRYVLSSELQLSKIGQTIRSIGGHTCRFYGACVGTDALMVLGMRIPEQEYKDVCKMWRDVYRQLYPPITQTLTSFPADAPPTHDMQAGEGAK